MLCHQFVDFMLLFLVSYNALQLLFQVLNLERQVGVFCN